YLFTNCADCITAPSEAMKAWAVKNWHIPPEKIEVIPNLFSPSAALLNIPLIQGKENKKIIFFGRLNVLKGLVNATFALKKILAEHAEWKFVAIGDDGAG